MATLTTNKAAPVIAAQRLRKGSCGSPRGAKRLVTDALATVKKLPAVPAPDDTWQAIEYIDALFDQTTKRGARPQRSPRFRSPRLPHGRRPTRSPGGSSVRRIPDLNPHAKAGQATLFQTWRFHAFCTTSTLDTVIADKTHRGHAIIEQVHADMKNSALAHLPSGIFNANAAWLVLAVMAVMAVMAFNLTRAAATLGGTTMAKATTATIRRKLIHVPARIVSSPRRLTLHLPNAWPWEDAWTTLFTGLCEPPPPAAMT